MKYLFFIITIAGVVSACVQPVKGKNGVVYKSPVQYNDYIVGRQTELLKNLLDMGTVAQTDLDSAGKMLDKAGLQVDSIIVDIKGMPAYKNDSSFRDAAIGSFNFYKKIFGVPYRRILEIRRNGDDATIEGMAELKDILEQMKKEEEKYDKAFHNAQKNFAEKNHMELKSNEMQKKVERANE